MRSRPRNVFGRDDIFRDTVLRCDAVVIGSGAGGAVVASELAEAGLDVIVLEEGSYHGTEEFSSDVVGSIRNLYRDGGASVTVGVPPVVYAEGRCVGGLTVVNGGMSWRTPENILDRWAREDDIDDIRADDMAWTFDRVEKYLHATTQDPGSIGRDNELFKAGADAKGWQVVDNIRDQLHCAGTNMCGFGCPTGAKRSTLVSYIPRALAFGARVYSDVRAHRLITKGKKIVGVEGHVMRVNGTRGHRVEVRANVVVVSAGAVQTPGILMRSGIKSPSGELGKNLTLHPNAKVVALFDEAIEGWKGVHQAYQVRQFLEEGFLMAAVNVPPGVLAMGIPYYGKALGDILADYNRILSAGILVEDSVSGHIRLLPGGTPMPFYQLSDYDAERIVKGTSLLAELLFAAGARRVILPFDGCDDLLGPDDARALLQKTIPKRAIELMTVHVMGTARMGGDRSRHVCDPYGKVYDTEGLYVADASVFPSPIGVNPMETIMALATRTARRMLERGAGAAREAA